MPGAIRNDITTPVADNRIFSYISNNGNILRTVVTSGGKHIRYVLSNWILSRMLDLALLTIIANAEITHGIPAGLLQSLCTVESSLNPYAVVDNDGKSGRSSYGVCQVQLRTAEQFREGISPEKLLEPNTNAYISGAYLRWQYNRYGDWRRAVVAYNAGISTGGMNDYSRKVWRIYGGYKGHQKFAYSEGKGRGDYRERSIRFIREDLAWAD